MSDWKIVRITSARQVAEMMDVEEEDLPSEEVLTVDHYASLKERGEATAAVDFVAHALPRFEGVCWAAHVLDTQSRTRELPVRDRLALDTVMRWIGDTTEPNRLAAREASDNAGARSAERLLALAVYLSGGTMSLPDLPPVNPPPEACARFAAGAVKIAAFRTEKPKDVLENALVLAEAVANGGVKALAAA